MKIQNKITLLFTLLSGTIILLFCTFIYLFTSTNVRESFYHRLEVRSEIAAHSELPQNNNKIEAYNEVKNKYLKNLPAETHRKFETATLGAIIDETRAADLPPDFITEALTKGKSRYFSTDTFYVATFLENKQHKILLVSSAVDESGFEELNSLQRIIGIGFGIALLLLFTLGRLFANIVFKPVREIIKKVNIIEANNLHLRLEEGNGNDEVSDLSVTFNSMLNRLETTFELQNNFVSNASHELKTPLTVIAGEAELALGKSDQPETMRLALEKITAESGRLEQLMNGLLSLAQTGFDGKKLKFEEVRIDELILRVKMAANRIFQHNKIEVDYDHLPDDEEKLYMMGNPGTLKVALLNVLINACKYSGEQKVEVKVQADDKDIIVTVTDSGIGIPPEELSQIFVPFFRASNTEKYKGYGIGLPLSLNIIRMHGGRIDVTSVINKGTSIKISIPFIK
jgi:signal transduction histidine kinase